MKKCLICNSIFTSSENTCCACGMTQEMLEGFPAYASIYAYEGPGFKSSFFAELANLEANNFWFRVRNRLIIWALDNYCPDFHSFLEIGCGTGFVLSGIANVYPRAKFYGSELFIDGLKFAAGRLPSANLMQMDAKHIPFVSEFDCIGAFDVLEHIQEDMQVLCQIHQALKPNGIAILTVPQHMCLWSSVDVHSCHVRRYSAKELHIKLRKSGFEILRSTSFVTSLLPAMFISRFIQKFLSKTTVRPNAELNIPPWLNFIFEKLLNMESLAIRGGINFSIGGSRMVVARKFGN